MFLLGRSELPDTLDIIEEIREGLKDSDYEIEYAKTCKYGYVSSGPLVHSSGEYQIEIVIQKKND